MSMGETSVDSGFSAGDFRLLEEMAFAGASVAPHSEARIEALWAKAARLVHRLGEKLFAGERFTVAIWPDTAQDERLPFIWARLKRAVGARYATHIGIFLAPDQCNLCIDLEKDLLDAGSAAEHLDQVLDFYRCKLAESIGSLGRSDVKVWTDPHNVVSAAEFPRLDFERFRMPTRIPTTPGRGSATCSMPPRSRRSPRIGYKRPRSERCRWRASMTR